MFLRFIVMFLGFMAILEPLADLLVLLPALLHPLSLALLVVLSLTLGNPLCLALNTTGRITVRSRHTTPVSPSPRARSSIPPATRWNIPSEVPACRPEGREIV